VITVIKLPSTETTIFIGYFIDADNFHRLAVALPANLKRDTMLELSQKNARACRSGA
jgi:hypothetical protein